MEGLQELTSALSNGTLVSSPTPYGRLFPKIGGSQPQPKWPKTSILLSTDFKFGQYIHTVHPKKPVTNFGEKLYCQLQQTSQQ